MSPNPDPRVALHAALEKLDWNRVDDPLSPFLGEAVVSRDEVLEAVRVFLASTEQGVHHGTEQAPEASSPSTTACRDEGPSPTRRGPNGERSPEAAGCASTRGDEAQEVAALHASQEARETPQRPTRTMIRELAFKHVARGALEPLLEDIDELFHESHTPDGRLHGDVEAQDGGSDMRGVREDVSSSGLEDQAGEGPLVLGSMCEHEPSGEPKIRSLNLPATRQPESVQGTHAGSGGTSLPTLQQDGNGERSTTGCSSEDAIPSRRDVYAGERGSALSELPRQPRMLARGLTAEPADSLSTLRAQLAASEAALHAEQEAHRICSAGQRLILDKLNDCEAERHALQEELPADSLQEVIQENLYLRRAAADCVLAMNGDVVDFDGYTDPWATAINDLQVEREETAAHLQARDAEIERLKYAAGVVVAEDNRHFQEALNLAATVRELQAELQAREAAHAQLLTLVARWRESPAVRIRTVACEITERVCADELEAALQPTGGEPGA